MYLPSEVVKADAIISNQQCNLALEGISLSVEQELTINCGGHVYFNMFTLAEKYEVGVSAKEPNDVYRFITIDLKGISFSAPDVRDCNGV